MKPRASPKSTTRNCWSDLKETAVAVRVALMRKNSAAPSKAATNAAASLLLSLTPRALINSPAAIAGRTSAAWLASVPYQGIRPRNSRSSVVPMSATHAPAVGPPRKVAAMSGASETPTIVPRGMRTGSADATKVTTHQNTRPACGASSSKRSDNKGDAAPDWNQTSRGNERDCARCHDSNNVELQLPRHSSSVPIVGTLAPPAHMGEQDLSTEGYVPLLEAPKRRASSDRQRSDCAKSCQESHETILHRSIL